MIKEAYELGLAQAFEFYGITKLAAGLSMAGKMFSAVPKAQQFASTGFRAAGSGMRSAATAAPKALKPLSPKPVQPQTFGQRAKNFWNQSTTNQQMAMGVGAGYVGNRAMNGNG